MSYIYALFVAALWLALVIWFSRRVTRALPRDTWRVPVALLLTAILLPLPLVDELIAKPQFKQMCLENAEVVVDNPNSAGRTVQFGGTQRTRMKLAGIDVTKSEVTLIDSQTKEPVYHYSRLEAAGGWFVSHLGISDSSTPLLFDGFCQPKGVSNIRAKLGVVEINRLNSNARE